jgi:hypothetical protein
MSNKRQQRKRRNRRKAKQRSKRGMEISHEEVVPLPVPSAPMPIRTSAERLFKMCQTRPQRFSKTRNLQIMSGNREWREDEQRYVGKNAHKRSRITARECHYDGVTTEFRRDRREQTPYSRDIYGPRERKVTHGECTPVGSNEHFFDHVDFHVAT